MFNFKSLGSQVLQWVTTEDMGRSGEVLSVFGGFGHHSRLIFLSWVKASNSDTNDKILKDLVHI
jgi:hypothetical protein